jgi:hypothetical protein
MKIVLAAMFLMGVSLGALFALATNDVSATCGDTQNHRQADSFSGSCGGAGTIVQISKTVYWTIYWLDGYSRNLDVTDDGQCYSGFVSTTKCWPQFNTPYFTESGNTANWYEFTYHASYHSPDSCDYAFTSDNRQGHTCSSEGGGGCSPSPYAGPDAICLTCTCSPVLIDVSGNGFALTDASGGVDFDLGRRWEGRTLELD